MVHSTEGSFALCHSYNHSCYHRWTVYGDRSVPPADEKASSTDDAALTDEELAEIEAECDESHPCRLLIATLRASRAEVAVLTAKLESAERMRQASFDRSERLSEELSVWRRGEPG